MRSTIVFVVLLLVELATVALVILTDVNPLWTIIPIIVLTLIFYFVVLRPLHAVEDGMNLLRAQDYASRLRLVGQKEADTVVNVFNEMMDRLKGERLMLEERNLFLQRLIESSVQGIVITDYDNNPISHNPAAKRMLKEIDLPALEDGESTIVRAAKGVIYRVMRQSFKDKGFSRYYYIIETMTEELRQAERDAYGRIIRIISHEVNNTAGSVESVLQIVSEIDDKEIRELVQGCTERMQNLTRFIASYSNLVKLSQPELEAIDLAASIQRIKQFISAMTAPWGIAVNYDLEESCIVQLDMVQWEQVIINIVKNSVESINSAQNDNPRIDISTTREGIVRIADNGPGLSAIDEDSIFTPFYTTKPTGQGIGLMLISEILTRHGCEFSLSTHEGITSFVIAFK